MKISAQELARILDGVVDGDGSVVVSRPARIESAPPGSLTFLANPKYEPFAYTTRASIMLVDLDFKPSSSISPTLIRVPDVYKAMAILADQFEVKNQRVMGIATSAVIHDTATIGDEASIGEFVVVDAGATIGARCTLHHQVYLGHNVRLGDHCVLHPGARILAETVIGDGVTIHSNTVIGSDGFGYVKEEGKYRKMKQLGNVVIESNVEIGANAVVDRASLGSTIIREGSKIDNLVQIAHNVEIGEHTVIAAQAGIAGSTRVGADVMIGGQAGIVGHITVGRGTQIQAQSGVNASTADEAKLYGSPALDYTKYLRSYAVFRNLPRLRMELASLTKMVKEIEKQIEQLQAE